MEQKCQKVHLVLPQLSIQNFTSSTLPISLFHQGVNLDKFIAEANCSLFSISKYNLYIGIGILIEQKWQK